MKLIILSLKYCKKAICVLLILLTLASPYTSYANSNYQNINKNVQCSSMVPDTLDIFETGDGRKVNREEIDILLKKAQIVEWKSFDNVMTEGRRFVVVDYATGRFWVAERTFGGNHADIETIDKESTDNLNKCKHDHSNWRYRAVLIIFEDGSVYAASSFIVFHAGVDGKPPYPNEVHFRSSGYGYGYNLDKIPNNGASGHNCIHVRNSTNHFDGKINQEHQKNIDFLEKQQKELSN
ncbi:MAG: hypothetical protein ACRCX2_33900 [Paraclostridium sp.]